MIHNAINIGSEAVAPSPKELNAQAIIRLAKRHGSSPFNARDAALIAFAGLGYFDGHDLSLVRVSDLITERGKVAIDGYLPSEFNANGKSRYYFIGQDTYLADTAANVIAWRHQNDFGCIDRDSFAGLDPNSKFFLKDDGSEFSLTYKGRFDGDTVTQPLQLQRHFKSFYLGEGVTLSGLLDCFVVNYWNAKCGQGTTQAIRDLMELTGLAKETLRAKCIREQQSIREVMESIYQ